jgi:hypothetical protein
MAAAIDGFRERVRASLAKWGYASVTFCEADKERITFDDLARFATQEGWFIKRGIMAASFLPSYQDAMRAKIAGSEATAPRKKAKR